MNTPIHILSLGAGVQSSTLALMAARGEVTPMPAHAIFADTGAEPRSVYDWLDWLEKQLPYPIHRVSWRDGLTNGSLRVCTNQKTGGAYYKNMIPAFLLNKDGSFGQVQRHCTHDYKIRPILKAARKLGGITRGQKIVGVVQWIGISTDEAKRMKPSNESWCKHRWPLIELRMTRNTCLDWMKRNGYPSPPRSACVYCPYHRQAEWRRLKTEEPEEFARAVRFERDLQKLHATTDMKGRIIGTPFLHDSRRPLDQVNFANDSDNGQLSLWDDECEGMCGVYQIETRGHPNPLHTPLF